MRLGWKVKRCMVLTKGKILLCVSLSVLEGGWVSKVLGCLEIQTSTNLDPGYWLDIHERI